MLSIRRCECGCGEAADGSFALGHDSEALRMFLHLEGVLDHDEPVVDFLHRRGYGPNGPNLRRAFQDRLFDEGPPPPIDGPPRIRPGQLTASPASTCSARATARSSSAGSATSTGRMQSKTYRSGTSSVYLYDTDDAFRDAFNEAVDRIRAMDVTYITVPENEDAGALQALTQFHAAVELGTLELCGGGTTALETCEADRRTPMLTDIVCPPLLAALGGDSLWAVRGSRGFSFNDRERAH